MALKDLIAWKGRYTEYILNDPKATFNFTKNSTHTIQTCVRTPFVFMIRPAKYDPSLTVHFIYVYIMQFPLMKVRRVFTFLKPR